MEPLQAKEKPAAVHKISTRDIVLCALFTALIAVGAFLKIPTPLVPITFQLFFVSLSGLLLGKWKGAVCCACYLLIGLIGIPIFTKGGGFGYVFEPTFGYIVGFVFGSFLIGWIAGKSETPGYGRLFAAVAAGVALVYAVGFGYYYLLANYVLGTPVALYPLFVSCVLMCLPGDAALSVVAVLVAKRVIPLLRRRPA